MGSLPSFGGAIALPSWIIGVARFVGFRPIAQAERGMIVVCGLVLLIWEVAQRWLAGRTFDRLDCIASIAGSSVCLIVSMMMGRFMSTFEG
jgi:hypothetical protein